MVSREPEPDGWLFSTRAEEVGKQTDAGTPYYILTLGAIEAIRSESIQLDDENFSWYSRITRKSLRILVERYLFSSVSASEVGERGEKAGERLVRSVLHLYPKSCS